MASIPLALSIHNFINKVGADAGFASIIGLAILVLLYFAQARETATLREHATEAGERIQALEARISQLLRSQAAANAAASGPAAAARPQPAAAANAAGSIVASRGPGAAVGNPAAGAGVLTAVPAAPAGVGAPALTAATKLIPGPVAAPGLAGTPVGLPQFEGAGIGTPPATVAGGAGTGNGHARESVSTLEGLPAPVAAGPPQPPPRVQIRPGQTQPPLRRPASVPRAASGGGPPSTARRILAAVLGALVVAGAVVVLLILTSSGGSGSKGKSSTSATSNAPTLTRKPAAGAVNPANVTVAVLNGTPTNKLANRVGVVLSTAGYKDGTITNAPDQNHTSTVVAYLPTFKREAIAVAKSLKVPAGSVQAIDPNTQAVACPAAPAVCTANVVVTVGANLAGTP